MRKQRWKETPISFPQGGFGQAITSACAADPYRIYLGIYLTTPNSQMGATTNGNPPQTGYALFGNTQESTGRFELHADRHGLLVQQQWFIASPNTILGVAAVAFELFEWDGPDPANGSVLAYGQLDVPDTVQSPTESRAAALGRLIRAGIGRIKRGVS